MGTLDSLSALISAQTDGTAQNLHFYMMPRDASGGITLTTTRLNSMWAFYKSRNGSGETSLTTTPAIPDKTSYGALNHADATSGKTLKLVNFSGQLYGAGQIVLYDRLYHVGGFSGTVTTAQAPASSTPLTRNTGGVGNVMFVEIHTQIGSTARTATVSYKNQAGTTKTSKTFAIGGTGNREKYRLIAVPLADGDTGVTEFLDITLSASTATAGSFGVIICNPLADAFSPAYGFNQSYVVGSPVMPEIHDDAALMFGFNPCASSSNNDMMLSLSIVEA
ncbi:hypothetical protein [Caudoviricetes sp.]|nr:hypothetical protein [Caudoviricetes sp.]